MSAVNWLQAAASSRRSLPSESSSAWQASGLAARLRVRNSLRMNASFSLALVSLAHWTSRAPFFFAASSSPLPLAPPACTSTMITSSAGDSRYALTSLTASAERSCAARTTITFRSAKSEGVVSSAN